MSQILRLPAVLKKTGLSRSTIYLLISRGDFPARIKLGQRSMGFLESDIEQWVQDRAAKNRVGGAE